MRQWSHHIAAGLPAAGDVLNRVLVTVSLYAVGMPSDHVIVTSTVHSEQVAQALATGIIEAHLGACAQVVGPVTSVYRWKGKVQTEPEWRLEVKTTTARVGELTEYIKANHAYDLPEILAMPIEGGSAEFLDWVVAQSAPAHQEQPEPSR